MDDSTRAKAPKSGLLTVVAASATGTTFEWYDFFIFGTLASIIAKHFYAGVGEATGFILALATFAVGFVVRPLGALVFGAIGDLKGRKAAFLITITMMGLATVAIGLLPDYAFLQDHGRLGVAAPLLLIALRMLQGFALGGEYGGAAIYVAEHAPNDRRAGLTSWINAAASLGLLGAFAVILATHLAVGEVAFQSWGWRIAFLASAILLATSLWIRLRLSESPAFRRMEAEQAGRPRTPLIETFLSRRNLKSMGLVLFGVMIAQGAVWYTAFFYAQFFMQKILKVDETTVGWIFAGAALLSAPLYVFFGWLSDRIGRKPVMLFGMGLAILLLIPGTPLSVFQGMTRAANPALADAQAHSPVVVVADPTSCTLQFDPVGKAQFASSCDLVKSYLTNSGVSYTNESATAGAIALVRVGATVVPSADGRGLPKPALKTLRTSVEGRLKSALKSAGYPDRAAPAQMHIVALFLILMALVLAATALYGPQAAALVELFPTRIRYTGMGVPYNIGTGWVGGLLPAAAFAMMADSGNIYFGLWYPVAFTLVAFVVCLTLLPESKGRDLHDV